MVEKIEPCLACEECRKQKEKERKDQEIQRIKDITEAFTFFQKKNSELYNDGLYLNVGLLELAVISYYDDIYRFKDYSGSRKADRHKQAAYTIKWISKMKPIQVVEGINLTNNHIFVNAAFALYAGFAFLDKRVPDTISDHYMKHLLYTCLYRNISGRNLASTLYVVEQYAMKKELI